jgi:hypothetical protein
MEKPRATVIKYSGEFDQLCPAYSNTTLRAQAGAHFVLLLTAVVNTLPYPVALHHVGKRYKN